MEEDWLLTGTPRNGRRSYPDKQQTSIGCSPIMGSPPDVAIRGAGGVNSARAATQFLGKEVAHVATRMGRDGRAVEAIFEDGTKIDITLARVKEWILNSHPNAPAGTLQKMKFDNFLPGSKGYKRMPTKGGVNFLTTIF